jgi:RNA polymerase sigma-32 factor
MKATPAALTPTEITMMAKTLNVKESDVIEMEQRIQGGDIPLEPTSDDGEETVGPIAFLADAAEGPSDIYEREQSESLKSEGLSRALHSLDDRSRRIITSRWLAESDPKTLHELAGEFGVSAERIRQIEVKAMQKMKAQLAAVH